MAMPRRTRSCPMKDLASPAVRVMHKSPVFGSPSAWYIRVMVELVVGVQPNRPACNVAWDYPPSAPTNESSVRPYGSAAPVKSSDLGPFVSTAPLLNAASMRAFRSSRSVGSSEPYPRV